MANDEEIYKIIVQVEGQAELARLKDEVTRGEAAIAKLVAQFKAGEISQEQFAAAATQAAAQVAAARQILEQSAAAQVASQKAVAAAAQASATAQKEAAKEAAAAAKEAAAAAKEAAAAQKAADDAAIASSMALLNALKAKRIEGERAAAAAAGSASPSGHGFTGTAEDQRTDELLRYAAATQAAGAKAVKLADVSEAAQAGATRAAGGFKNMGMGVLFVSQAIEDAQYGFSAIVNNIPAIVMAFGGSGGLAGGISIASVGINLLIKNWDHLGNSLGMGHVKTAAEEMEELRKKTELTANEAERLARADNLKGKVGSLRGGRSNDEQTEEAAATAAINEVGLRKVVTMIRDNKEGVGLIDSQGPAKDAAEKLAAKDMEIRRLEKVANTDVTGASFTRLGHLKDQRQQLLLEREDARNRTAEEIAAKGTLPAQWAGYRDKIAGMADAGGMPKLANALRNADPDKIREKEDEEYRLRTNMEQEDRMARFRLGDQAIEDERAKAYAASASPAARKLALTNLAAGAPIDKEGLARQFGADIKKSGGAKDEEVGGLATKAAEDLAEALRKSVAEEAAKAGISGQDAAKAGLIGLEIDEARRQAESIQAHLATIKTDTRESKVMGSAEFARSLLSIQPKNMEGIAKQQLEEAQRTVAKLEEVRLQLRNGVPARVGAPR